MIREAYMLCYGLTYSRPAIMLPDDMLCRLSDCKDDEARRLILGISDGHETFNKDAKYIAHRRFWPNANHRK